ncbi:MAG: tetratricopeptide repeat protein [Planctomycetales bacterium]|nr:tetratricopeptide repeat protein [Planctomycetales bacterium]
MIRDKSVSAGFHLRVVFALMVHFFSGCGGGREAVEPEAVETSANAAGQGGGPTFAHDVGPIVFQHCAVCHRPGEGAPFELLTYADVASRATQIAEVTATRYMPPWLPEPGSHRLAFERRLTEAQIQTIQAWAANGKLRGDEAGLPPLPEMTTGWQLGEPDLVVRMDRAFELPAEGRDVYRNFVVPIPLERPRWVSAMELRPDNRRVVHHAFLLVSHDGMCRRLDAADAEPGYEGMEAEGAESPDGHFVSWQPGKMATHAPDGMAWLLTPGTDLVVQMHLQPTGKPESVQAEVGFYFTDQPPTRFPMKLALRSTEIDIPAGVDNYTIETRYTLPTEVRIIGLIPHAHYLGKTMEALAIRPDGREEVLLRIPAWDFNWQGDYRFATPPLLPSGTTLVQRFTYDNSSANVRNPHTPPQRVRYGLQSVDEMGELWFQVEPTSPAGRAQLQADYGRRALQEIADQSRRRLRENPRDVKAIIDLGKSALALQGPAASLPILRQAVHVQANSASAHYYLGHALLRNGDVTEATAEFRRTQAIEPDYQMAWHDLGMIDLQANRLKSAENNFRRSLQIAPYHATSLMNLGLVLLKQNQLTEGIQLLEQAMQVCPTDQRLNDLLQQARQAAQQR